MKKLTSYLSLGLIAIICFAVMTLVATVYNPGRNTPSKVALLGARGRPGSPTSASKSAKNPRAWFSAE